MSKTRVSVPFTIASLVVWLCSCEAKDGARPATKTDRARLLEAAGSAHFAPSAGPNYDRYTLAPSTAEQAWMRDHYWRLLTYSPYFDARTSWYSAGWVYADSYAIYPGTPLQAEHPDWILKDANGIALYIQWGCAQGSCPQFAADIGNPDYRANWIADAKRAVAEGYRGLFVDDVNLDWRISDGWGNLVQPVDPRTGQAMPLQSWRRYFADFMEEVRAALPGAEIIHNALWFVSDSDPDVARQLAAANFVYLERGVNDAGVTGGGGPFGFESLLAYVDRRHAAGAAAVFDGVGTTREACEYNLASYFLVSHGLDASACTFDAYPDRWWSGYDVALGEPLGGRYAWNELLRRDFAAGAVLVNQPGSPTRTVSVGGGYSNLDGRAVDAITLAGGAGVVLVKSGGATPTIQGPPIVSPGTTVTVSWSNIPAAWWNDYIALCPADAPNGGACVHGTVLYADDCAPTATDSGRGTPTGSCEHFHVPDGLAPGSYAYRYYRYDSWDDLQATFPVTVVAPSACAP
jgi:Hypothetical glycosyl hydrolase family 15